MVMCFESGMKMTAAHPRRCPKEKNMYAYPLFATVQPRKIIVPMELVAGERLSGRNPHFYRSMYLGQY